MPAWSSAADLVQELGEPLGDEIRLRTAERKDLPFDRNMQLIEKRADMRIGEIAVVSKRVNEPETGNLPRRVGTGVGRTGQERIGQDRADRRVDPGKCAAGCRDRQIEQCIGVLPAEDGMDEGL